MPAVFHLLSAPEDQCLNLRSWKPAVWETTLFLFCAIPGLLLSLNCLQEPWTLFRVARSSLSLSSGHIVRYVTAAAGYRSEHIGGEILQTALLSSTGWPPASIALLPLGSLLIAIHYYAASRAITSSRLVAAAIALYSAAYYPRLFSQYATQTYVWTNILFLTFLILLLRWLPKGGSPLQILMLLIFMATFLHYHTTPVWMIILLFLAVLALKRSTLSAGANPKSVSWALPLFALIFFLQFDTVLYGDVLARLGADSGDEALVHNVLSKLIAPILDRSPDGLGAFEMAPTNPRLATWTNLLILLMLTTPVGCWCLHKLRRVIRERNALLLAEGWRDLLVWSIVTLSVLHALLYLLYGALSLRMIPLGFPLLIPIVLSEFELGKKLERILPLTIAAFAILGFCSFLSSWRPDTISADTGFIAKLLNENSLILADANAYGAILMAAAEDQKRADFIWPDAASYASLASEPGYPLAEFDLFVADSTGKPVIASNWVFLEPWTQHLAKISENESLSKVYDSDNLKGFSPPGADLPRSQPLRFAPNPADRSLLSDSLRLFAALSSLLFLPGITILIVVHQVTGLEMPDFHGFMALATGISISVITFIGYILNFTSPGINSLNYVTIGASWLILMAVGLSRHRMLRLPGKWACQGISIFAVLLTWSFLATAVAHAREKEHAAFTEFFVTRAEPLAGNPEALVINVVNRFAKSDTFTIVIKVDGASIDRYGPQLVSANSVWQVEWVPPQHFERDEISIVLESDGLPRADLRLRRISLRTQTSRPEDGSRQVPPNDLRPDVQSDPLGS